MKQFIDLPKGIKNIIVEYLQEPHEMILTINSRRIINRLSNKIKEIGAIVKMKYLYPLYHHGTVTEYGNKNLYYHGKKHYMKEEHYLITYKIKNEL